MGVRLVSTNAKGGVGKTAVLTNLAPIWAERGRRVLVVDLDPQSNQAEVSYAVEHDEGRGLYDAVYYGDPSRLRPLAVRDNIDLVAAGVYTGELAEDLVVGAWNVARKEGERRHLPHHKLQACGEVAEVIAAVGEGYDLVLIDTPPAYGNILGIAGLAAADHFIIPTRAGRGARNGLEKLWKVYESHQIATPLLGVVLVGVNASARSLVKSEVEALAGLFGEENVPLLGVIRDAERATYDQEEMGLSISEYRDAARTLGRKGGARFAGNVEQLYEDYEHLADAIDQAVAGAGGDGGGGDGRGTDDHDNDAREGDVRAEEAKR